MLHHRAIRIAPAALATVVATVLVGALALGGVAQPSAYAAGSPRDPAPRATTNPLAGGPWGIGNDDPLGDAWRAATGTTKTLLARVAGQPRVEWFYEGTPTSKIYQQIRDYITLEQQGNPNTLVQMALFHIYPRGESKRTQPMTDAEVADYKAWMREAARAIGSTRAAIVLEPDLAEAAFKKPGAINVPDNMKRLHLVHYAVRLLANLPRTATYIDAGDSDWLSDTQAARMLINAGVGQARGFALGTTHYTRIGANVRHAAAVEKELARRGYRGKKAVIDTVDNGKGWTWHYWNTHKRQLGPDFDNARVCRTAKQRTPCDTLGHAPTWQVGTAAKPYVDGFLWVGKPYFVRQAGVYSQSRTLGIARTTPYSQKNITGGVIH